MGYEHTTLDFYDDMGAILKDTVSDSADLPDFIKTAASVTDEDPGNCFALVMVDDGKVLKKFATADKGNTWLSSLYFSMTKDRLPPEAQKVAAANLLVACEHYGIEAQPDLYDLSGDDPPTTNVVDVTNVMPAVKVAERQDVNFAIERADGSKSYPLDNAEQLAAANEYFSLNKGSFVPRERREFAVKVASVADKMGMPVSDSVREYSGSDYSPVLEGHLSLRYQHLMDTDAAPELRTELMKLAQSRASDGPDSFADGLYDFDKKAGLDRFWDRTLSDPWYSTFGMTKKAYPEPKSAKSYTVGADTVSGEALHRLAAARKEVSDHFGMSFANAFLKDPESMFESMPMPQKKVLARMANDMRASL
tara:strand:- start:10174 stop:11265 length:1092 start_codon:yes stop_codon:yes gene_type:complete